MGTASKRSPEPSAAGRAAHAPAPRFPAAAETGGGHCQQTGRNELPWTEGPLGALAPNHLLTAHGSGEEAGLGRPPEAKVTHHQEHLPLQMILFNVKEKRSLTNRSFHF